MNTAPNLATLLADWEETLEELDAEGATLWCGEWQGRKAPYPVRILDRGRSLEVQVFAGDAGEEPHWRRFGAGARGAAVQNVLEQREAILAYALRDLARSESP